MNYYNEFDPDASAWLGELASSGCIPAGRIDARSVADVAPDDLREFTQCHFFAGIGGWAYALKLAGWPDDQPVWTASLPCQPFSVAGKGLGKDDERHLWPVFRELVRECRPPVIFGEQVASAAVLGSVKLGKNVQEMRDREAVLRVLRELQGASSDRMQGVRDGDGACSEISESKEGVGRIQEVEEIKQRQCPCGGSQISSQGQELAIRSGCGGNPESNQCGGLRSDGDTVCTGSAESVERPVIGQDRPGAGICEEQRQGGVVLPECDGEHLGSEQDLGDCVGDFSSAGGSVKQPVQIDWGETETEVEQVWFDGIRADLEREGYAVWACSANAPGVGAPHIRQRLYWGAVRMADAGRSRSETGIPESEERKEGDSGKPYDGCGEQSRPGIGPEGGVFGWVGHSNGKHSWRNTGAGDCEESGFAVWTSGNVPLAPSSIDGLGDSNLITCGKRGPFLGRRDPGGNAESRPGFGGDGISDAWSDYYLIPCRDGKVRRVGAEPILLSLVDGISSILGTRWNSVCDEIENVILNYAEESDTDGSEALRTVWGAVQQETIQAGYRGSRRIQEAPILLFTLCKLARRPLFEQFSAAPDFAEIQEASLRAMWEISTKTIQPSRPSHQQGLDRPSVGELADTLCGVPSEAAQHQAEGSVPDLRNPINEAWILRAALPEIIEVWNAFAAEVHGFGKRNPMSKCFSTVKAINGFPLSGGVIGRKTLLKGYGNAIVPQLAAEFVKAFMDCVKQPLDIPESSGYR